MLPRCVLCAALLLLYPVSDAAAKPTSPKCKNTEVSVTRGGSVRIPLRGYERGLNSLTYSIAGNPRYGSLSDLTQYRGPDRQGPGYVVYTHNDDDQSTNDTFMFEARASATGLRGRGKVEIVILDTPARAEITPRIVDFGKVAIGDPPVRRELELANVGGGILQGFLETPAPFVLEGDGAFAVRRGRSTRMAVLFAPERVGPYSFPLQPVPGDPANIVLSGEALPPFSVEFAEMTFASEPDRSRTLRATVTNNSQSARKINVRLPPETPADPIAPLTLAPGGTAEIVLRIPPEHKTNVPDFPVYFESENYTQMQNLSAPPVPAELVVVAPPDFGVIAPRRTPKATLVLRNDGGTTATGRLEASDVIVSAQGAPAFSIDPGEEFAMELELRLKNNAQPPAEGAIDFRGTKIVFPVKATLAATATPTPTPTATPGPTPRADTFLWALNEDIECLPSPAGKVIRWTEKSGWTDYVLQHRANDSTAWQAHVPPAPHEGLFGGFWNIVAKIESFLSTPIERDNVDAMSGVEEKFGQSEIATASVGSADTWRLLATQVSSGEARAVTDVFRITAENKLVAAAETPATDVTPTAPAPMPALAVPTKPRPLGPITEIASAGIKADRRSATLQVALRHDPSLRGFRLERGAMVSQIDAKTGIPGTPEFEPLVPPGAEIEVLFFGEGEAQGNKLTVCAARIDGLEPGTRTYWRLVPAGPSGDLPPTTVLLVDTIPPPPFPWNKVILGILTLLLVGILYLRWKINRPPH